jgi:hypothetical protein
MEIAMKKLVVLTALLAVGMFTASGAFAHEHKSGSVRVSISAGNGNGDHNKNTSGVIIGGIGNGDNVVQQNQNKAWGR